MTTDRSYEGYLARATSLLEAGFGTKQAQKDANDYVGRAFDFAREAFNKARWDERGDTDYYKMPEAWRMLDMPYSAAHWNAKRAAALAAYPEAVRLANGCAELRAKIMATPVVKKPPQKTAKQREADEKARTCQICGRPIFAETGVIAHHGYQRPGDGYQTASCPGARELPFEADKQVLVRYNVGLRKHILNVVQARRDVMVELAPVRINYDKDRLVDGKRVYYRGMPVQDAVFMVITRQNFEEVRAANPEYFKAGYEYRATFDAILKSDLVGRKLYIDQQRTWLAHQEGRAAAWVQKETWSGTKWELV